MNDCHCSVCPLRMIDTLSWWGHRSTSNRLCKKSNSEVMKRELNIRQNPKDQTFRQCFLRGALVFGVCSNLALKLDFKKNVNRGPKLDANGNVMYKMKVGYIFNCCDSSPLFIQS